MRSLSKKNFEKSIDLCRYLKEPVDLDKKGKTNFEEKEEFLRKKENFRLPVSLYFEWRGNVLLDD